MAKVIYKGKTSGVYETFTALDWLARLVTHIPGKGEQMVRYYGYYSNKSRGMRKKENNDDNARSELVTVESNISRKKFRKNRARLIQKIYNVDPAFVSKMWQRNANYFVYMVPCVHFILLLPTSMQRSVWVAGYAFPCGDFHPAR